MFTLKELKEMEAKRKGEWVNKILKDDKEMHKVARAAQNQADSTIDENIWTRLEAQTVTDQWDQEINDMNRHITKKIKMEMDPTANPDKKFTKIEEFNILDN